MDYAFPMTASTGDPRDGVYSQNGLTRRDYFLAKIMQGFCANPAIFASNANCGWAIVNTTEPELVSYAEHIADLMCGETDAKS